MVILTQLRLMEQKQFLINFKLLNIDEYIICESILSLILLGPLILLTEYNKI